MATTVTLRTITEYCGYINPTEDDIAGWNELDMSATTSTGTFKFGLFGWDLTCIATWCNVLEQDDFIISDECHELQNRGLDGHAFGAYWKIG